jgi:3-oxoacyl-ACP reductase-like protein
LRIIVALKTKKSLEEIVLNKSIKDLSGGKSTLQNEILADLQKEFGEGVPDRSEELSLKDLGAHLKPIFTKQPGKFTSTLLAKMFTGKMPAGFTAAAAKDLLDKEFGLGPKAADQLFLFR